MTESVFSGHDTNQLSPNLPIINLSRAAASGVFAPAVERSEASTLVALGAMIYDHVLCEFSAWQ
jgi:hypothetical protein